MAKEVRVSSIARRPAKDVNRLMFRYGPWAVVTGASDGIGRAFAQDLAAAGFSLILVARRADCLRELAVELADRFGTECDVVALDLEKADSVAQLAAQTQARDVGLLIAAAGFGTSGPFLNGDFAADRSMIAVNCQAVAALAHAFALRMRKRGRGGLVLLSSLVAFQGVPRAAHYAATKAYVQVLAEGLRPELKPLGIDVLAVAPGPIASGFAARAGMTMGLSQAPGVVARDALAALGRTGTVRPGWLSKLLESGLGLLPRQARTWIMQRVMAGMTP
ncbi:MAG: short-chain dehydrogenase [Rhizobiales bacterium 32-66-8]|nr:MAG: short-chain dehydrogenase [Rhizobiales bacterium 32-66-8]